jgi:excisionase family DNA binding protein
MILYTVQQAAKELGVSPVSVRRMVRAAELPHRRIGSLIRFTPDDLAAYVAAAAVPARQGTREVDRG